MPFARLVAALILGAAAGPAAANMAAPAVTPGYAARLAPGLGTSLEVAYERLAFACDGDGDGACALDATYLITNPTAEPVETPVVFLTYQAEDLTVSIDGRPAPSELTPEEDAALDATAHELATGAGLAAPRARIDLRLVVEASGRREVRVRGRVSLGRVVHRDYFGFVTEAPRARHLVLAGRAQGEHSFFDYLMSPINTWARVGEIRIAVAHPARWDFAGDGAYVWSRARRGDYAVETTVTRGPAPERLRVSFYVPPPAVENGGVILGAGARLGDGGGFRARLGYEIAWGRSRLISLSADTDLDDHLTLTPAFELALPAVLIIPSLGVGVGVPVEVRPETRVGVRAEVSAMLYAAGVVWSVDWFPGAADSLRATMLGRVSF